MNFIISFFVAATVMSLSLASMASQQKFEKNMQEQSKTTAQGAASQKKIDQLASQTRDLSDQYRMTLHKIENAKIYNEQMRKLIQSQKDEEVSIKEQIVSLKETNKEITPLMLKMTDVFEKFVELDVPFLPEERAKRVADLKAMMNRADISVSEKYRRVLEAYQVENEFGRTIEAYRGKQLIDGKEVTVDFLRVGRVALMYRSLDGEFTGMWDKKSAKFIELPGEFERPLVTGLKIARKQVAPNLFKTPIAAPEVIQ